MAERVGVAAKGKGIGRPIMMDDSNPFGVTQTFGHLTYAVAAILLGFIPLFKSMLQIRFEDGWIAFLRVATAFLAIALFVSVRHALGKSNGRFWISREHLPCFLCHGCISIAVVSYCFIASLSLLPASVAVTTLFATVPLTTIIASIVLGKEVPGKKEMLYIIVITSACALVNWDPDLSSANIKGIAYAIVGGIAFGLYSIFGKNLSSKYDYPTIMFWQFAFAAIALSPFLFCASGNGSNLYGTLLAINLREFVGILGIGIVVTFVPYILFPYGLRAGVKATTASSLTLLEPVSTTIVAFLIMGETLNTTQAFGIALVLVFIFLLTKKSQRKHLSFQEETIMGPNS